MLDKIRLHGAGQLPDVYVANMGEANPRFFDARCCQFLGIRHADLAAQVLGNRLSDEQALTWCEANGTRRSDADCETWNGFMSKLGWRDAATERLAQRVAEYGLDGLGIQTFFEMIDRDEAR
jgi:gluconokinase